MISNLILILQCFLKITGLAIAHLSIASIVIIAILAIDNKLSKKEGEVNGK